jgi:hypothetical protein
MTSVARLAGVLAVLFTASSLVAEVIVLRGGVIIDLKSVPVRRGNNVILTRSDGTVLSVPASEIDRAATATRAAASPPVPAPAPLPAATLAGAARAAREVPKARVRITDADVSHSEAGAAEAERSAGEAQKETEASAGAGRVEVADYTQEKSGDALIVRGTLKNPGATPAINVRMSVTAIDAKGQAITSAEAGISNGVIEPSKAVAFTATIPIGARPVGSLKFAPRWVAPSLPAPAPGSASGTDSAARAGAQPATPAAAPAPPPTKPNAPPPPAPTPYGRGSLYAAPPANAPSQPPADGKTGYIPGASNPANQPKPPS